MRKTFYTLLLVLITLGVGLKAQINVSGFMASKTAGKYRMEVNGCGTFLHIAIFDLKNRPVYNKGISGSVEFFFTDESSLISAVEACSEVNAVMAIIPSAGYYNCRILLFIGGESVSAMFDNECELRAQVKP